MDEDLEVLKEHVEALKLDQKTSFDLKDVRDLRDALVESDEMTLANYVFNLKPGELEDLIVNNLYA
jgi:hypothetical protein